MSVRRVVPLLGAALLHCMLARNVLAADITTGAIVGQTTGAASACARWQPVGICYWLRCSMFGCSVHTSLKVGHYNPDLVVSAYHKVGGNPWTEMRSTLGGAASGGQAIVGGLIGIDIGEGNRTESRFNREHAQLRFKEADAIGHPVASLTGMLPSAGMLCPSETTAFLPYFKSTLDALAWRMAIPEQFFPQAWVPGMREIGLFPVNTWSAVYPRSGFVSQPEDPKAGAVAAQRAGDIVTRAGQPHVYIPVTGGNSSDLRVWSPGPLVENDETTGTWQMLTPVPESSCDVFGINDALSPASWSDDKVDEAGDYAWTLWRPYRCCQREGQIFLGSTDWTPFP